MTLVCSNQRKRSLCDAAHRTQGKERKDDSSKWPTTRQTSSLRFPEFRLRRYRSSGRALLGRRMGCFSKTPTASNPVIYFRVELHLGAEPPRHRGADSNTANDLSPPSGARESRWDRCRNGNGKRDVNRRTLLPSSRSESVGALLPATPGGLAHAVELRGFRWQQEAGPAV